jgi:hypothetical protein
VLRTAANRLNRRPHVAIGREQIPARLQEPRRVNFPAFVDFAHFSVDAAFDRLAPCDVSVAFDHGVAAAEVKRLVGIQRGVNPAIHDLGPLLSRKLADLVPSQGIACVDADSDDIAVGDSGWVELLEGFISDERVAIFRRRGGC